MDLLTPFLSDLVAGLVGAAILGGLALLLRWMGPERGRQWVDRLRRFGWPLLAIVFFATALMSAILQPPPRPIVVSLGTILVLILASVILFRFGPLKIRHQVKRVRAHVWPILTGLFFLSTVTLLVIGVVSPPIKSGERIVFVVDLADEEMMVMRDILDELEPELGAEVFLMGVESSRYIARLDRMVASGNVKWDLIALDNNMTAILAAKSLVEDLSNYDESNKLVPQSLLPSVRPLLECEGRFYFAPFRPNVKIAFYNEPKFEQYGLRPPMTWEELLEVARVFYEKEGVGRVAIQGYPGPATAVTVFEFIMAAGGDPMSLDDSGSRAAFAFLQKLEPYLAHQYVETRFDTANEFLIDEEVYLVCNWTYGIKIVVEDAGKNEIKAYSGWRGPQGEVHVLGGDVLAVPKGAPNANKAVKLIELLLEKDTQKEMLSRLRWLPVRFDAYEGVSPELAPYFEAVNEALSFAVLRPTTPQWPIVESILDSAFEGLVREGNDIALLEEYRTAMENIPSQYLRYLVQTGDTLELIAHRYNTTVDILAEVNCITTRAPVGPGWILLIPQQ
jgi:trehalose transport system substrate-binding protein